MRLQLASEMQRLASMPQGWDQMLDFVTELELLLMVGHLLEWLGSCQNPYRDLSNWQLLDFAQSLAGWILVAVPDWAIGIGLILVCPVRMWLLASVPATGRSVQHRVLFARAVVVQLEAVVVAVIVAETVAAVETVVEVESVDPRTVTVRSEFVRDLRMLAVFVAEPLVEPLVEQDTAGLDTADLGMAGPQVELAAPETVLAFAVVDMAEGTVADTLVEPPAGRQQAALAMKDNLAIPAEVAGILELVLEIAALRSALGQSAPAGLFQLEHSVQNRLPREKMGNLMRQYLSCLQQMMGKMRMQL